MGAALVGTILQSEILGKHNGDYIDRKLDELAQVWMWLVLVVRARRLALQDQPGFSSLTLPALIALVRVHIARAAVVCRFVHDVY